MQRDVSDARMTKYLTFDDAVGQLAKDTPGLYEIWTVDCVALKVGISCDLRSRLRCHAASRQSGLTLKDHGSWDNPDDVSSKASIFAKHLFFDSSIARDYDLKCESGRRAFIRERCRVLVFPTVTMSQARDFEVEREQSAQFRYVGRSRCR